MVEVTYFFLYLILGVIYASFMIRVLEKSDPDYFTQLRPLVLVAAVATLIVAWPFLIIKAVYMAFTRRRKTD